ncbi:TetR/AcrR family transcriptional regulator, partial [Stenotrophomonas maltophilia]|uniref:TetR/AcrR family transcriptional regulator n=1 Tax=Stenotrophomonas maltophilia TaxID=40324 RepID=UPI0013DCE60C
MRKVDPDKHEARRQQILKAAIACFTAKGFHRTSTAEICAEAGMSPGNLFH